MYNQLSFFQHMELNYTKGQHSSNLLLDMSLRAEILQCDTYGISLCYRSAVNSRQSRVVPATVSFKTDFF